MTLWIDALIEEVFICCWAGVFLFFVFKPNGIGEGNGIE